MTEPLAAHKTDPALINGASVYSTLGHVSGPRGALLPVSLIVSSAYSSVPDIAPPLTRPS